MPRSRRSCSSSTKLSPDGRAVAERDDAEHALQSLEAAVHLLDHRGEIAGLRPQMQVAVMGDLVSALQDRLAGGRMRLDRPSGDEERRLDLVAREQLENFRQADASLVAAIGQGHQPSGIARIAAEPHGFGVDVEAREQDTAAAVGPSAVEGWACRVGRTWPGDQVHELASRGPQTPLTPAASRAPAAAIPRISR